LGDARDAGLIPTNVAARRRGRGRKSKRNNRRRDRSAEKKWATPLQVLLIAERCALLSGQDDDFIAIVTAGWTGVRWGELIGLERHDVQRAAIHLDWQLSELNGRFEKMPPKDDSYRVIDLPPFLSDLLAHQITARPDGRCRCPRNACGGRDGYLFLGTDRGHPRRSGFNRRFWHPAVDGLYPATNGQHARPARPVLVDMEPGWPGTPLRPAWPPAIPGQDWEPPRGRGRTNHEQRQVASCLPIKSGLVPHGLRHGHKTWVIEDAIPEVLQHDRLGHEMDGIKATYSPTSPTRCARTSDRPCRPAGRQRSING
jgi:integrase